MRLLSVLSFLFLIFALRAYAVPPVLNYAGQVAVDGEAFDGSGLFKFALVNVAGTTTYWSNDGTSVGASEPQGSIQVPVNGGLYSILLGNTAIQGMSALDPSIFQQYSDAKLRVWFSDGVNGFQQLSPDRTFASVPYAFSAGSATIAQGSIEHSMLSNALRSDLNSSIKNITRDMLPDSVLSDLNRTITRDMLPPSVLADLNRTITKSNLGSDVLSDLNSSISLNRLSPEVLAALQVTPSISTQPFARYDWRTDSATIEARGHGHNLSYQWLKNGQVIAGANAPVLELSNPVLDDNATYSVQLTNSVGQTTSQTITLRQAIGAPGLPLAEANATQVPRNGLVLWMDANDLNGDGHADSLLVGDRVSSWTDKITDKNATQSDLNKQPVKATNGSVSFDGSDSLGISELNVTASHIFIVAKFKSSPLFGDLIKDESDNNMIRFYHGLQTSSNAGNAYLFNFDTGTNRISGGEPNAVAGQTFVATISRGSSPSSDGNFVGLQIAVKGMHEFDGEISEILFYDRFLQNNERDAIERYLADKWSIQLHADKLAAEQAAYDAVIPVNEPEDNLQVYYKFEPISLEPNKLWDHSGNQRHLNLSGFTGDPWSEGVEGQALMFDGINDKVTGSFDSKFRTMSFWLCPEVAVNGTDTEVTVLYGNDNYRYGNEHFLHLNKSNINGSGHFQFRKDSSIFIESSAYYSVTHNTWFHLALVSSNDQGSDELSTQATYDFYINGNKIDVLRSSGNVGLLNTSVELNLGVGSFHGRLDEFRAYDRPLLPFEIQAFHNSIKKPLINLNFEHNATVGANFSLSLAADNSPTTYLAEGLPTGLSLNVSTGQISGTVSQPGYHRVFVKAMNQHGTGSDTIAVVARPQTDQYGWPVDVPDGSDIPQNGLVLWLDANDVDADGQIDSGTDHLKLANWADKAGKDHNATQATVANQPEIRSGQISGKPNLNVLVFEGNQCLGFERIKQIRTFFWAAGRSSGNIDSAIFYDAETDWISMGYGTTLWRNGKTSSIITGGQNRLNGNTFTGEGNFPTQLGIISTITTDFAKAHGLGKRTANNSFFYGRIGEILVYDRVLSTSEIDSVEAYLASKWEITLEGEEAPPDITSGLMAHIPFDENSGNVASDVSGNNRHATLVDFDTNDSWTQGKIGGALELDGTNDWISVPVSLGINYTFSLWLKTEDGRTAWNNNYEFTSGIFAGPNGTYGLSISGGKLLYSYASGKNLSSSQIDHGNWVHLCGTRSKNIPLNGNSGYFELFINGSKESGVQKNENPNFGSTAYIGRVFTGPNSSNTPRFLPGIVDDLRVYNRTLSGTEIKALYDLGSKPLASTMYDNVHPRLTLTPVNNSVTTAHLTEQILKYLKPEITAQPQANNVYADTNHTFSVTAEGKYLKYQWKKNGLNLAGETNSTLFLTDANATQHDGNYSVVVSNDFGSVESTKVSVFVANEVLDGLVGWWPLDGNASDFSGGQNHGTISGSPLWVTGKIGDAVRFNSVNQQISTNSNFGTQNSISIWCNFSSTSSGQFQMVWSFSNPNLAFDSSAVSLNSMDSSANKFADFSALQFANQWLHFVTVNTSSQTELYLNAASIGTANYVSPSTNNFVIGKGGYTLNGIVDEVRIYDRALSNTEIQTLYNLGQ